MDGGNGADNPAKWWVIPKPFPFGLGRSFCAHSECGCMRASPPDLGRTLRSGQVPSWGYPQREASPSSSCVDCGHCRARAALLAGQDGIWVGVLHLPPSLVHSPSLSDLSRGLTLPTASLGLLCLLAFWQVWVIGHGRRERWENLGYLFPTSFLFWHNFPGNLYFPSTSALVPVFTELQTTTPSFMPLVPWW